MHPKIDVDLGAGSGRVDAEILAPFVAVDDIREHFAGLAEPKVEARGTEAADHGAFSQGSISPT